MEEIDMYIYLFIYLLYENNNFRDSVFTITNFRAWRRGQLYVQMIPKFLFPFAIT